MSTAAPRALAPRATTPRNGETVDPQEVAIALLERLRLTAGRLIVSEPRAVASPKRRGRLHLPAQADRTRRECGMVARVILAHEHSAIPAGAIVFIPEYAGTPLYDIEVGYLPYWVIGEGDVIAILSTDDAIESA